MDQPEKAILVAQETKLRSIYNYIDIQGVRQYLVCHPKLLLMFEILVNHIDDYINHRIITGKDSMNNSSPI